MNNAKKPENNKAVAQTAADNKSAVKAASAAEVKTETKTTSAASTVKPTAKTTAKKSAPKIETTAKKAAPKTETAAKKPVAKRTEAKPAKTTKTAEKSTVKTTAKTASKSTRTTVKKTAKATAKPAVEKAPAKRGGRKPAPVTIDTICAKLEKKIGKTKAAAIKEKIAVDIEVWGFEDGSNAHMYIEVNDGKITVAPYEYKEKDVRVSLSLANAVAFADGKTTLKKLFESGDFYADGNIGAAVKLSAIF